MYKTTATAEENFTLKKKNYSTRQLYLKSVPS